MKKLLISLFLLSIPHLVQAQMSLPWGQQYAALQEMQLRDGKVIISHFYIDNQKVRVDSNIQGMQMTSIMRMDQKMMYMIMPAQKMVTQTPLTPKDETAAGPFNPSNLKYEQVGEGDIQGIDCQKYKITYASNQAYFFWINKQTHMPVLMEAENGAIKVYWKNVVPGPQPDSLFEVPADYKMVKMPTPGQPPK